MSRLARRPVSVITDANGAPCRVDGVAVIHVFSFHREWIGALLGEPERDIWRLETTRGIVELQHIRERATQEEENSGLPQCGSWLLSRQED